MPKNDTPAAKKTGGQGAQNEQAPVGSGGNSAIQVEKSTSDLGLILNQDSSQNNGSFAAVDQPGVNQGAALQDSGAAFDTAFDSLADQVKLVPAIAVTAHRDGYRRAGRGWGKSDEVVMQGELDDEQLEQLQRDPNIRLRGVMVDPDTRSEPQ